MVMLMAGYTLILAEKPSAARNFAKALGGRRGVFEGTEYCICSLVGHVMGLSRSAADQVAPELVERYESWDVDLLPWDASDIAFARVPDDSAQDVLDGLADTLKGAREVCIATDVDPSGEGELLAWEALDFCGWQGRTTRMYHADEEASSVRKAFSAREELPSMERDGDYVRAWVRDRWDWLSMQWTRAATGIARECGVDVLLREGRLKSVIVSLVAAQQAAYDGYRKVPFFEARFRSDTGVIFAVAADDAVRVASRDALALPSPATSSVTVDSTTPKRKAPPRLPDLTDLAARLAPMGIAPKQVLETYQAMYEDQVVSYPRTEDRFVSPEQFREMLSLTDRIAAAVGVDTSCLTHIAARKTHVRAGGAHGANRPGSHVPRSLSELDRYGKGAREIYKALATAWLATLAEDKEFDHIEGHVDAHPAYVGSLDVTTSSGWTALLKEEEDEGEGEEGAEGARELGTTCEAFAFEGKNRRPQRPTVKWLKGRLEKYDVGTASTRTSTIAEVSDGKAAQLFEHKGVLSLADLGLASSTLLNGCLIADPSVTEGLHQDMTRCGTFEIEDTEVLAGVAKMVSRDVSTMRSNAPRLKALVSQGKIAAAVPLPCPRCGMPMRPARSGTLYFCSSRKGHKGDDGSWVVDEAGCGFRLGTSIYGQRRLSANQVAQLLAGKSVKVSGLKSKTGATYGVVVRVDKDAEWGTSIEFMRSGKRGSKGKAKARA